MRGFLRNLTPSNFRSNILGYYEDYRRKILQGIPIENKIVEDTKQIDVRVPWLPANIQNEQFVLLIKKTLGMIPIMQTFLEQIPEIKVLVLVRNPYDNISSWKHSFPHLAKVSIPGITNINPALISESQKKSLDQLEEATNYSVRRCLLWNFVADSIIENISHISLIRYEELIENPEKIMKDQFEISNEELKTIKEMRKSKKPKSPSSLTIEDRENIKKLCHESAGKLGYTL